MKVDGVEKDPERVRLLLQSLARNSIVGYHKSIRYNKTVRIGSKIRCPNASVSCYPKEIGVPHITRSSTSWERSKST